MAEAREMIGDAIRALVIDRRGSLSWFGHVKSAIPAPLRRSITRRQLRDSLHRRLEDLLYRNFYCIGFAAPPDLRPRQQTDGPAFVEEISKANSGCGVEDRGWKLLARRGSTVIVSKDRLTLEVASEDVRTWSRGVAVRFPKELRGVSPGFYTALGNHALLPQQPLLRVYWNIRADGAIAFIRHVTAVLNEASIPFHAKICNDPQRFDRCDAAVLYAPRRTRQKLYPILQSLRDRLQKSLDPLTPVFTKNIAPGVAVAESPPGEESFGLHRCGVVAEGLLRAEEKGKSGETEQLAEVIEAFERHGLSLQRPFLNPGSNDLYPRLKT